MSVKDKLKTMTPEEIEDWLINKMKTAEREADQISAAKLLMQRKGMIQHGNAEKKDYREVIIGGDDDKAGGSADDR